MGRCRRASRRSRASSCGCSCRGRAASRSSPPEAHAMSALAIGASRGRRAARRAGAGAAALARAAGVRRAARCCSSALVGALAVPAGHRQRVPAGAGQLALQPRDRGARASRPHRRPQRRGARDLDAGEVALGVSRQGRGDAGAARRSSRSCSRRRRRRCAKKLDAGRRLRLPRAAGAAGGRRARRWRCGSRASTTRTSTAASIPAAKR